jgi:hypothetical protein
MSSQFSFSVVFGGHASAMVARHNGAIIGYAVSSGHVPHIVITSPDGSKPLMGQFDLSWQCDACSGFGLQWAYSGPIYGEAQHGELPPPWAMESPVSFNAYAFPAASSVHFTIVASDGFLEVTADSAQLTITGT